MDVSKSVTFCMHVFTMGSVSQKASEEHSEFFARLLRRLAKNTTQNSAIFI